MTKSKGQVDLAGLAAADLAVAIPTAVQTRLNAQRQRHAQAKTHRARPGHARRESVVSNTWPVEHLFQTRKIQDTANRSCVMGLAG